MRFTLWLTATVLALTVSAENAPVTAVSPDGRNLIRAWSSPLAYEVVRDGVTVVAKSEIGLKVDGQWLVPPSESFKVRKQARSGKCDTPVYKKAWVDLSGTETRMDFGDWALCLVARDDGVAYRFETARPGKVRIDAERADVNIPDALTQCALYYGRSIGAEESVPVSCAAREIATGGTNGNNLVYLPFAYGVGGKHVAVVESDVHDYPIWDLKRAEVAGRVRLEALFAPFPKAVYHAAEGDKWSGRKELPRGGRWIKVRENSSYLVETEGTRTFPWRAFVLADSPAEFCESDLVWALARPPAPRDFSWVKPGKVAWDWWNAWDNLDRDRGCTTAGYRRFIDFAASNRIEYVILDEGWSEKLDIWKFHPQVDVPAIIRYGNERGVGIILWMAWAQVCGDEERVARHFAELGARGFKVDFMDRGDADCERFLWRFAEACAQCRMLVDYHGAHRPTGMSRAYPNVLNYEGVHGLECSKWFNNEYDFPDNDVKQFFLRMTAGPMDYTPGAMDNYPVGQYRGTGRNPGSVGTRTRQLAMMVAYEAPLQMLCDAPSKYERNLECLKFMAQVPVVWARTLGLGGDPDTYAAVARQAKDGAWYVAALNGSEARTVELNFGFLDLGDWRAEVFRDDPSAKSGWLHECGLEVSATTSMSVRMARGGGVAMRIAPSGL